MYISSLRLFLDVTVWLPFMFLSPSTFGFLINDFSRVLCMMRRRDRKR